MLIPQVCCHNNPNVSFFALDALRQLAMNFLEKEELSHFRFQKDFLRPFEYTIVNNKNSDAREMVSFVSLSDHFTSPIHVTWDKENVKLKRPRSCNASSKCFRPEYKTSDLVGEQCLAYFLPPLKS
jgi:hypothetical protein